MAEPPDAVASSPRDADRQIADAVAGLILRLDAAGRVTFVSAGGGDILGAASAALLGRPLREAVHPGDVSTLDARAGAVGLRLRGADGEWVAVEAAFRPVPGTTDRVATIRPAPEAGVEQANLRMSRDHYRALVDTLPQLVWMERADTGETIYVNQAFEACCGPITTTREARAGLFHPDDAGAIAAAYARAQGQDRACEVQGRVRDGAGAYRWYQLVFRPLLKDARLIGWLGSALDIDEIVSARESLAETGELLRLAQEAAGAGLFDVDVATRDVLLSPESAHLHGLPGDRPAVLGLADWMRRIAPADRPATLRAVRAAASAGRTFDVAFRVAMPGEGARWIQAIGRLVHGRTGRPMRVVGLTLDITARKDSEAALVEAKAAAEAAKAAAEAARAEAERADAAKTDFLSTMSHEIRTPLNAMIGFAGLLSASERLDGDLRRYADLARAAGENLRTVVDDILDFSSVEAGALALRPEPFTVRGLIDGCLGILGASAAAKGLTTTALVDPAVPDGLVGDPGRLRQILLNLLNNAVKFTHAGTVTVTLHHEGRTPWGERIRFSVVDTGIGIAPAQQDRLFQRFSQADSSVRRTYGGSGLGLAISRQLVERMGGAIGVTSQAGHGATFWFTLTLPRAPASTETATPEISTTETGTTGTGTTGTAPVAAAAPPAPARRTGTILLVEDVEINRELACIVLRAAGHAVDVAVDGIEAVRAVEAKTYDLVLMDVQMPRLDGMMATRLIRCLPGTSAAVPVIAMTANVLPDQLDAFRDAGMDGHFGKPYQPHELCAAVQRWLGAGEGGDAAEPVPAGEAPEPAIDRHRYEDNLATLGAETLNRLLAHFHARLRDPFPKARETPAGETPDSETLAEREAVRAEAHALAAAAGLLGFVPLGRACAALDRADPASDFAGLLERARALAATAAEATRALLADPPGAADAPRTAAAGSRR